MNLIDAQTQHCQKERGNGQNEQKTLNCAPNTNADKTEAGFVG